VGHERVWGALQMARELNRKRSGCGQSYIGENRRNGTVNQVNGGEYALEKVNAYYTVGQRAKRKDAQPT